ncbi:heat-inducible transcriptional repressor HrcA [Halothermothrix orenii]|uniref:Heat-inducible transcription repressor HrcA n=1 Tax=Halothermothrix orenii (strain H 168 / OCM 544 / DSM 9562) TaxID=373903 RepID=B8CXL3_HALOH|nr:heat-inducible transcriptional repressor HrcA [Halothermothrix orenii]ACL70032.1 heat-inducible transcription repressor HrcA [Halothermothrix orenii H 168]
MVDFIDDRKRKILKAIVQEHILTAEPIGSRTLAKNYEFGVSSATIRNEMSDLEDMGYLEQPYTSAGRVPSDKGYRYYVDSLMETRDYPEQEIRKMLGEFTFEQNVQTIMSNLARMLSRLTRYTAVISEPQLKKSRIREIKLLKVSRKNLLIVLVTDTGIVNNKIISLTKEISSKQLRYLNEFFSRKLQKRELNTLDEGFLSKIEEELLNRLKMSERIIKLIFDEMLKVAKPAELKVHLGGTSYILEQPEFNNLENLKKVLNILDHEEILGKLLNSFSDNELKVVIGHENQLEEMHKCSIVIATYCIGDKPLGKLGVIGPTRMHYPMVVSTVNSLSKIVGKIISRMDG